MSAAGFSTDESTSVWYEEAQAPPLSWLGSRGRVFIVNGSQLPLVDWRLTRRAMKRSNSEVVVFGADDAALSSRYDETVEIGQNGELLRFHRHYHDSPAYADRFDGEACFIAAPAKHAPAVVQHILARGWGLDSIGALTRRFTVRWNDLPCVVGGLGQSVAHYDSAPIAAFSTDAMSTDHTTTVDNGVFRMSQSAMQSAKSERETDTADSAWTSVAAPGHRRDGASSRRRGYFVVKRAMDILISATGLLVLAPLMLAVAVAIKLTSRGPVLFRHRRQGRGGREFSCLKFRTMVIGAEAQQAALRSQSEVDGPQFKIDRDPRLTRIGQWLRHSNIDELPQLINVLRGDMSLVGPRPSPDDENQLCPAWRRTRLSVRPGITGLWQVLRRRCAYRSDFQEWIYYDIEYVRHCNLWLDFQLILYTPVSMFRARWLKFLALRLERRGICKHSAWLDAAA